MASKQKKKVSKKKRRVNKRKRIIRICILLLSIICIVGLIISGAFFAFNKIRSSFGNSSSSDHTEKTEEKVHKQVTTAKPATADEYDDLDVDEVGTIPVMMYHGIHSDIKSKDTGYTGGNVDVDGYQRTGEAFKEDLEFYYENDYRCIRLDDYLDGFIDCEKGMTPIVLTFDDGLANNIIVTGEDKNGELIIDPGSAVGIMEEFKKEHPDMNITATFFINQGIFNQPEYNSKILHWLVDHGYDVGNHTASHPDFTTIDTEQSEEEVGYIYDLLEKEIPGQYVNIVALPFGSPYDLEHSNMSHIYKCNYEGKTYKTKAALRVAWEANESPFSKDFIPNFIKRIRAYDNDGVDSDIEQNFEKQVYTRYISDGDPNTVVVRIQNQDMIDKSKVGDKEIILFE